MRCGEVGLSGPRYAEFWHQELEDRERGDVGESGEDKDEHRVEREVMRDEPCEDGSTGRSGGTAEADDRADAGGGEHVGGRSKEVCGPALMGGSGEAEESDGRPRVVGKQGMHVGDKHDWRDAEGADKESELAAGVDAVTVLHAVAREPSAGDGAEACSGVDDNERVFHVVEVEAIVVVEELREIEEIKPPDGV